MKNVVLAILFVVFMFMQIKLFQFIVEEIGYSFRYARHIGLFVFPAILLVALILTVLVSRKLMR